MKLGANDEEQTESNVFSASENKSKETDSSKDLLARNLKVSEEILDLSRYIKRYIKWQKIMGWVKLLLIVVPVVWGLLYLPALLKDSLSSYGLESIINPAGLLK